MRVFFFFERFLVPRDFFFKDFLEWVVSFLFFKVFFRSFFLRDVFFIF